MNYHDLTPEQKERLNACTTPAQLLALAQEEGMELTDEQLEQVSGGAFDLAKCIDDFSNAPQMY